MVHMTVLIHNGHTYYMFEVALLRIATICNYTNSARDLRNYISYLSSLLEGSDDECIARGLNSTPENYKEVIDLLKALFRNMQNMIKQQNCLNQYVPVTKSSALFLKSLFCS